MANFPNIKPSYVAVKKSAPAYRIIRFGSGYQQRAVFGINQKLKVYELVFNVNDDNAGLIEKFLDSTDNIKGFSFPYTIFPDPNPRGNFDATTLRFVCLSWTSTVEAFGGNRITATFEEVPA